MAFGIDDIATGVSLLSGLGGLFGSRKPDPRLEYLNQLGLQLAQQQSDLRGRNRRGVYSLAGTGGDAIAMLGRRMGSDLAGAGVYNSSATAGALTQAQRDQNAQIAGLANENLQDELANSADNMRYLTGLRLGIGQQDVDYNRQQRAGTLNSLASFLGRIVGGGIGAGSDKGRKVGAAGNGMQNYTPASVTDITTPSLPGYSTGIGGKVFPYMNRRMGPGYGFGPPPVGAFQF